MKSLLRVFLRSPVKVSTVPLRSLGVVPVSFKGVKSKKQNDLAKEPIGDVSNFIWDSEENIFVDPTGIFYSGEGVDINNEINGANDEKKAIGVVEDSCLPHINS